MKHPIHCVYYCKCPQCFQKATIIMLNWHHLTCSRRERYSKHLSVFISQLIRYAKAWSSYECFILKATRLSCKLLWQGYVRQRLKSSLRKYNGRYADLIENYEVPLSQMLHDILGHDDIQWHPPLIIHFKKSWPCYKTGPYYRFSLLPDSGRFQ